MKKQKSTTETLVSKYKIECSVCGKHWRDKRRDAQVEIELEKDPDYLKNYVCRRCKRIQKLQKTKPAVAETIQAELKEEDLKQFIPHSAEKYVNRYFSGVKDEDIIKFHYESKNPLLKNILFIGETGCMPKTTTVKTKEGDMPIDKVSKVLTYNLKKKVVEEKDAIIHKSGKKELWKLHTKKGVIECSPEHKWLVYRKGSIIKVMTKEIVEDDLLVEIRGDE